MKQTGSDTAMTRFGGTLDRHFRTIAALVLILFCIPIFQIWDCWDEYRSVSLKVASFDSDSMVPLQMNLIEKPAVSPPEVIKNLFSFSVAAPPVPVVPPPVASPPPVGPSMTEILSSFRNRLAENLRSLKLPEDPPRDFSKIRLRGFYRRNGKVKAMIVREGKLLLVSEGEAIVPGLTLEKCRFGSGEISLRDNRTGKIDNLLMER